MGIQINNNKLANLNLANMVDAKLQHTTTNQVSFVSPRQQIDTSHLVGVLLTTQESPELSIKLFGHATRLELPRSVNQMKIS